MQDGYSLKIDQVAIGLTKPAMKMGVPLVSFFMSIMLIFFGWMFYQVVSSSTSLIPLFVAIIFWWLLYLLMLWCTFNDPFGLHISWMNCLYFRKTCTHAYWDHMDSYSP